MEEDKSKSKPKGAMIPPKVFKEDEYIHEKQTQENEVQKPRLLRDDKLGTDSEYHTATEFIPEFHSDNEPPEDKVKEAKMILKTDKIRVYKRIVRIGKDMIMPAKYDQIRYRMKETQMECMEPSILDKQEELEGQMGITITDAELITCLSNIKEGEKSSFRIEEVGYDEKKRRIVKRERFLLAEMISWQTIIDINGDFNLMKRVTNRGTGQKRFSPVDEISFKCKVFQLDKPELIIKSYDLHECLVQSLVEPLPDIILEILQSSKAEEEFECTAKHSYVMEPKDGNKELIQNITSEADLIFQIEVESIYERLDLFQDGSVIKKITKKSYSTAAPDSNSRIYFDYRVSDCSGHLIHQSKLV